MIGRHLIGLPAVTLLAIASLGAGHPKPSPQLVFRASYDTGLGANGSEIISIRHSDGMAALTNVAGSVDVLDLSNPLLPRFVHRVTVDTTAGTPNSVAVHPHHDYFLVVLGRAGQTGRVAAYRVSDGLFLDSAPVGIQPDSIAIAPNGQYAVIANEAEAVGIGNNGGPGSLTLVDLKGFKGAGDLQVTNIPLPSLAGLQGFSSGRTDDIGRLAVDNTPDTLDPESVAFSDDSRFAYVTLQENNGVVRLHLKTAELTFFGLGTTSHLADLTNGGGYVPTENLLNVFREPDGIALDQTGRFFATANEGDTRAGDGSGGVRGGRTVSIFDSDTGALLGETGKQLDDAAATLGIITPGTIPSGYPDDRSNRGASEPEVLDLTHYRGLTLLAVSLERANAVALVDVSAPTEPRVISIAPVDVGPEGIKFFRSANRLFLAAANEVSGTLTILEVVV
jgi:DNA-binding beta-propeller fold protein YncE